MIKIKSLILNHLLLLLTTITLYSSFPKFSKAQTNNNTINQCDVHAVCGAFSSCNVQDSPICKCLHGFVPINDKKGDWNSGNWTGGCERRVPLNCDAANSSGRSGNKQDGFLKIEMVRVPGYQQHLVGSEDQCAGLCLMNCSCIAYAHDNDLGCMFWNSTLFDIQIFHSELSSDLHFRVANSELVKKKGLKKIIISTGSVGIVGLLMSIFVFFSWKWMRKRRAKEKASSHGKEQSADSSHQNVLTKFNLDELPLFKVLTLANATDNFSEENKLGKGGFGPVFKGVLENGKEIAVKRLSKASGQGMQEFTSEVVLISKLQHRNLVGLLGCCLEDKEKMLVYEYMPNKSLDYFLFDQSKEILDWKRRFNIIEGICRGLLYLHRDSRLKIIHRDLKPSNILLDNDWNPKISDFGMARIFGAKQDHVNTIRVVGTYGYMAPEYAINGRFSEKSDVFSLGVLILEIISGKKNTGFYDHESSMNLLGHVWKLWIANNIAASVDKRISSLSYREEVERCIHIGLLCVQELPADRPSVSGVLFMLSSEITELPKPKKVAFVPIRPSRSDTQTTSQSSQKSSCSLNTVTLTMVDGR